MLILLSLFSHQKVFQFSYCHLSVERIRNQADGQSAEVENHVELLSLECLRKRLLFNDT